jgi:release factor glutamine methyltransferase
MSELLEPLDTRTTVERALLVGTEKLLGAGVDNPRYETQLVLMFALNARREDLIREPERLLDSRQELIFNKAISLRAERRPLAYITGESWFYGRSFKVNRAVLIPRPETEILVEFAIEKAKQESGKTSLADIGTGSGCIAVSIALELPDSEIFAVDTSEFALLVARKNILRHAVQNRVNLLHGDLLSPLSSKQFNVIVSNPPYIAKRDVAELMPEVGMYEPSLALHEGAGEDGTDIHKRLLEGGRSVLISGGWIGLEVGLGQADSVCSYAEQYGYKSIETRQDFAGIDRVVVAQCDI